jgi:hypothetical protein
MSNSIGGISTLGCLVDNVNRLLSPCAVTVMPQEICSGSSVMQACRKDTEDGSVCTGSMRVPTAEVSSSITAEWERGFFESAFTHPSGAVRLTSYKGGIIPMWTSVLGLDAFPDQYLVTAHETLLQFIRRGQK